MPVKSQYLYINVDSNSQQSALVRSPTNTSPVSLGSIVAGDTLRYVITAVDSTGTTSDISGDPNIQVNVGIGSLGDGPLVYSRNFVATGSAWSGSLNTDTGSLLTAMGTTDILNAYLEVELVVTGSTVDSGSHYTILQAPLTIRNQVIN